MPKQEDRESAEADHTYLLDRGPAGRTRRPHVRQKHAAQREEEKEHALGMQEAFTSWNSDFRKLSLNQLLHVLFP